MIDKTTDIAQVGSLVGGAQSIFQSAIAEAKASALVKNGQQGGSDQLKLLSGFNKNNVITETTTIKPKDQGFGKVVENHFDMMNTIDPTKLKHDLSLDRFAPNLDPQMLALLKMQQEAFKANMNVTKYSALTSWFNGAAFSIRDAAGQLTRQS
jgi:hypothetical protein